MNHKGCTLYSEDHGKIPNTSPRSSFWKNFTRWYKEVTFISYDAPGAKYYFRSSKLIQEEKMRQYNSKYWFCIHPFSKFQKYWQIIMCVTWIATLINDIYMTTFRRRTAKTAYSGKHSAAARWGYCILILNIICVLHMVICFLTGFLDKKTQKVIMVPKKIIIQYLKTWFLIDCLAVHIIVKINVLSLRQLLHSAPGFDLIGVLRYVRLVRLITVFDYLKSSSQYFNMSYRNFLAFWYIFFLMLVLHFNACLYYLVIDGINQVFPDNANNTWIYKLEEYYKNKRMSLDSLSVYLHCMMELLLKFNRGGENNIIRPQTLIENICQLVFALMGCAFQVVILAGFYQLFTENDQSVILYEKKTKLLKDFLIHKKLPKKLVSDILDYQETRKNIIFTKWKYLTPILNAETVYHFWKNRITDVAIFHGLDVKMMYEITNRMHPDVFLPNQVIYRFGEDADKFYGISFGSVAIYNEEGLEIMHLRDNDYFGIGLTGDDPKRITTVVAVEYCEVWYVTRESTLYLCSISKDFLKLAVALRNTLHAIYLEKMVERKRKLTKNK